MATKKTVKTKKTPAKVQKAVKVQKSEPEQVQDQSKRDFAVMASLGISAVGACAVAVPLIDSMNPSADVLAQSSTEVDISTIAPGTQKKVMWRGKPVFIKHRTQEEIDIAKAEDNEDLPDPETDANRTKPGKEQWLVMVGVCTHLGCIPIVDKGDFDGWFCPCHGSHYDESGRIRKGPARTNLVVPPYEFLNDTTIKIG